MCGSNYEACLECCSLTSSDQASLTRPVVSQRGNKQAHNAGQEEREVVKSGCGYVEL